METTKSFAEFSLQQPLLESLAKAGFENASTVQNVTIEPILEGKDIFAQAETGSGKTGAFAIPIIEQILRDNLQGDIAPAKPLYVVLSPTRELAQQTFKVFETFGKELGIKSVTVIGGEDIERQKKTIDKGIQVLVATPGRMKDLVERKYVSVENCRGVVFDEADRLFDMGFKKDIEDILSKFPSDRQLIMVSATNNFDVLNTAYKFNSNPLEVKLNSDDLLVDNIDHQIAMVTEEEKIQLLVTLLKDQLDTYAIIFCNTQFQTHALAEWLKKMNFKAQPISGRLPQNKRTKLMEDFRNKEVTILVCTDVAARGLDIKDVNFVVNYDLPIEPANYVHRIGRTGRAGKEGFAVSFCGHRDAEHLDKIYRLIDGKIPKMKLYDDDFENEICKRPFIDAKTLRVVERENQSRKRPTPKNNKHAKKDQPVPVERKGTSAPMAKVERRFFEVTTSNKAEADKNAMAFFNLKDPALLGDKVLVQGRKKFILFGARTNKYKYFIRPIYKRLLTPFLEGILKRAGLDLSVRVSYKEPNVRVNFSGKDEGLLKKNNGELFAAFELIIKRYLAQKIEMPRNLRVFTKTQRSSNNQEKFLTDLAKKMKDKVLKTNKPVLLKPLSPADRRIVHQILGDDAKVKTNSIGDGKFKKIEISPR